MTDVWSTIAAERGALTDDVEGLTQEQWDGPSLCAGWSIHDMLAHQTATAASSPMKFFLRFARNGFNFPKFSEAGIAENRGSTPAETLARFRSLQGSTSAPPGPKVSWLGEVIVHSEDMRRPLGIRHTYPMDAVRQVADFFKGSNTIIGTKNRIAGLGLVATDTDWSHGAGPEVRGPMLSLLMAMTGRGVACDDLTGEGVATLRERC